MTVRERIPLATLTTFAVGGDARYVIDIGAVEDIEPALAFIRERGLAFVVLGDGSNVLPLDEGYEGVVLRMRISGIAYEEQDDDVLVRAGAGVEWDALVRSAAEQGLWGIENLAGIPGTVGAAPVQNIGAYGMELRDTFASLEARDAGSGQARTFTNDDARFAYRDSRFKHEPECIITQVTLRLSRIGAPRIGYTDLARAHADGAALDTPLAIGEAVRAIRARKFPDLREYGTAGSFFKNPIISPEQFAELAKQYGAVPSFPAEGGIKVPLAFILDRVLGLRGYERGNTFLFGNQPLVIVAKREASAREIDALAREIEMKVHDATGITIEREVRMLDARTYRFRT